jgi:hypothetical protein
LLPLPLGPALAFLRLAEALRLPLPVSSENLLALRSLRAQPAADDLRGLGLRIRPAAESLFALFP